MPGRQIRFPGLGGVDLIWESCCCVRLTLCFRGLFAEPFEAFAVIVDQVGSSCQQFFGIEGLG
jgi:hypothetical protein